MLSLYAQYVLEREGKYTVETDEYFATYKINNTDCYIQDVFVTKIARGRGVSSMLVSNIENTAKEQFNCTRVIGTIDLNDKNASVNMQVWLKYGFKLHSTNGNVIYLSKDI